MSLPPATLSRPGELAQRPQSLEEVFHDFAEAIELRSTTRRTYMAGVQSFLRYLAETGQPPDRRAVIAYKTQLIDQGTAATAQTYLAGIRRFFQWATDEGRIQTNPAAGIKSPKVSKNFKRDCLSREQAHELLESIDCHSQKGARDYAMLALMLTCGLRDIEITRIRIQDIQNRAGQPALLVWGKGRDGADEAVKLTPPVERAIRQWLVKRPGHNPLDPLFISLSNRNQRGTPLTTRSVSRIVKNRLRAIGIDSDRITAHSLRHTCATLARAAGASREEVAACLRHASTETTARYDHFNTWATRQVESKVSDAIFKGAKH